MHTQFAMPHSDLIGTFRGELAEVVERTAPVLRVELHSSYFNLLECGLKKLIDLHPAAVTVLIELLTEKDFVIFATELQLTPDCTLIVKDVLIPESRRSTTTPISLHWRLQTNYGN
jgi:hypothetical protein